MKTVCFKHMIISNFAFSNQQLNMSGGRGEFFCEERGETDVFAGAALALASASVFNQF